MRVFVLGGTGSIGTAIVQELNAGSHAVTALSRSTTSDDKLEACSARPHRGDLRTPADWVPYAMAHDAIIHVAATFDDDMGSVDKQLVSTIVETAKSSSSKVRILYTGGCWLYGDTNNRVATEASAFDPLPAFDWMIENGNRLLAAPNLATAIVHPAMVYHDQGGVFEGFLTSAKNGLPMEIWGGPTVRWPLIERSDLARAYCELLVRPELVGHFNAVSEEGVYVGEIAKTFAKAYGCPRETIIWSVEELMEKHGAWAKGPTLDQRMSARKLMDVTDWRPAITDYRSSVPLKGIK